MSVDVEHGLQKHVRVEVGAIVEGDTLPLNIAVVLSTPTSCHAPSLAFRQKPGEHHAPSLNGRQPWLMTSCAFFAFPS